MGRGSPSVKSNTLQLRRDEDSGKSTDTFVEAGFGTIVISLIT